MINFFKDWADAEMSAVTEAAISESVEEITKAFEELADTGLAVTEEAISEIFEEVTSAFEELTDAATEAYAPSATSKKKFCQPSSIFSPMMTGLSPKLKVNQFFV
jgi:hypothetical protein